MYKSKNSMLNLPAELAQQIEQVTDYQIDALIVTPIVALPILFVLMMIVLFKPVKKVIAERQGQVDEIYRTAEEASAQAEHDRQLYSEKLAGAQDEADTIVKAATQRADRLGEEIVAEAKAKAADTVIFPKARPAAQDPKNPGRFGKTWRCRTECECPHRR